MTPAISSCDELPENVRQTIQSWAANPDKSILVARLSPAVVKAVIEQTEGTRLQVDFGHEQTALIHAWQVVEE